MSGFVYSQTRHNKAGCLALTWLASLGKRLKPTALGFPCLGSNMGQAQFDIEVAATAAVLDLRQVHCNQVEHHYN